MAEQRWLNQQTSSWNKFRGFFRRGAFRSSLMGFGVLAGSLLVGYGFSKLMLPDEIFLFPTTEDDSRLPVEVKNFQEKQKKAVVTMLQQIAEGKDADLWASLMRGEVPRLQDPNDEDGPPRLGRY